MKLGVLFSGGKDSTYAAFVAKKHDHELVCLVTLASQNPDSFMFHTPAIEQTFVQAKAMQIPLLLQKTKGKKETELHDLKKALQKAKKKYGIEGVVTGAIESVYQASRIQKICDELNLVCFNPLWQKEPFDYLNELLNNQFKIMLTAVAAFPLEKIWLGRVIDKQFINEMRILTKKYKIHPTGEGGEVETFVTNCPLFKKPLAVRSGEITGENNAWRMNLHVENRINKKTGTKRV